MTSKAFYPPIALLVLLWIHPTQCGVEKESQYETDSVDIPDMTIYSGHLFSMDLREYPGLDGDCRDITLGKLDLLSQESDSLTDKDGAIRSPLPSWLTFDRSLMTLEGVPSCEDKGQHLLAMFAKCPGPTVKEKRAIFQINVIDRPWSLQFDSLSFKMVSPEIPGGLENSDDSDCGDERVVASLILCASLKDLSTNMKIELVRNISRFLSVSSNDIDIESSSTQSLKAVEFGFQLISAGPGSNDDLSCPGDENIEILWQLPCQIPKHLSDFVKVLQHNVDVGRIREETGFSVIGWYVASSNSLLTRRRRRRRRAGVKTAPTPTPTLTPPSPSVRITPSSREDIPFSTYADVDPSVLESPYDETDGQSSHVETSTLSSYKGADADAVGSASSSSMVQVISEYPTDQDLPPSSIETPSKDNPSHSRPVPLMSLLSTSVSTSDIEISVSESSMLSENQIAATDSLEKETQLEVPLVFSSHSQQFVMRHSSTSTLPSSLYGTEDDPSFSESVNVQDISHTEEEGTFFTDESYIQRSQFIDIQSSFSTMDSQPSTQTVGTVPEWGFVSSDIITALESIASLPANTLASKQSSIDLFPSSVFDVSENDSRQHYSSADMDSVFLLDSEMSGASTSTGFVSGIDLLTVSSYDESLVHVIDAPMSSSNYPSTVEVFPSISPYDFPSNTLPSEFEDNVTPSSSSYMDVISASSESYFVEVNETSTGLTKTLDDQEAGVHPTENVRASIEIDTDISASIYTVTTSSENTDFDASDMIPSTKVIISETVSSSSVLAEKDTQTVTITTTTDSMTTPPPTTKVGGTTNRRGPTTCGWDTVGCVRPTRGSVNSHPIVENPIGTIVAQQGQVLEREIPKDLFYDIEDGTTESLTLSLEHPSGEALPSSFWLYLDDHPSGSGKDGSSPSMILKGLPLHQDMDINNTSIVLVATDSGGLQARDSIILQIQDSPREHFTHKFTLTFAIDFQKFINTRSNIADMIARLASHFGDSSTEYITVLDVRKGSFVLSWTNNTLAGPSCQRNTLMQLLNRMVKKDNTVRSSFMRKIGRSNQLVDIDFSTMGPCVIPTTSTTISTTFLASSDTGTGLSVWAHIILPILIALVVFIFILFLIFMCNRHRKRQEALSIIEKDAFSNDRNPIIFPNEMDSDDAALQPKSPLVLPSDTSTHLSSSDSPQHYQQTPQHQQNNRGNHRQKSRDDVEGDWDEESLKQKPSTSSSSSSTASATSSSSKGKHSHKLKDKKSKSKSKSKEHTVGFTDPLSTSSPDHLLYNTSNNHLDDNDDDDDDNDNNITPTIPVPGTPNSEGFPVTQSPTKPRQPPPYWQASKHHPPPYRLPPSYDDNDNDGDTAEDNKINDDGRDQSNTDTGNIPSPSSNENPFLKASCTTTQV